MEFLNDRNFYENRYDRFVIEDCLLLEKSMLEVNSDDKIKREYSKIVLDIALYFKKGDHYSQRENTIKKWMQDDKKKQDKYDKTPIPINITCSFCHNKMEFFDKSFSYKDKANPLIFSFRCKKCYIGKDISE